jgi:hypoxanthine phosphoribosyltransferase
MPDLKQAWAFLENSTASPALGRSRPPSAESLPKSSERLAGAYPMVLAVMGGAVVFAGQLLPLLRFPLDFDYIHASRYGAATRGAGVDWKVSPPGLVSGRTVLVLDDILDHGETMNAIRNRLLELGASGFYCAVLVEKTLGMKKPITADFVGLAIPDRFVFGCGMDAKGYWRNLPRSGR